MKLLSKVDIRLASVGSLIIKFSSALFTFINSILLARHLGLEGFGIYILAFSTATLLSVVVTLGLPNMLTRNVSKYLVHQNYPAIKGLLIKSNRFTMGALVVILLIGVAVWLIFGRNYPADVVETFAFAFLLVPFVALGSLRTAALRGMKLIIVADFPDTLLRNGLFTLGILLTFAFRIDLTPQLAIILQVVSAGIGFLIGYLFLRKELLKRLLKIEPEFQMKQWKKETIPFSINSLVQIVKLRALTFILAFLGFIEAVSLFEVALRAASLVSFTMDALNLAMSPFVSSAYEKKNMELLQRIVTKTSRIIFVFSLPVALAFIFGGEWLLKLMFGEAYRASYVPLVILCLGQLISSIAGSVGTLLNMTGNQTVFARSNVYALIMLLSFSVPMVMFFNTMGAALVFSSVLVGQNVYLWLFVRKKLNINTSVIS